MAYNRNQQARIDVYIGGTAQAKKQLQEMKDEASKLSKEIESMKEQQLFELDPKAYDELGKKIRENEKRLKSMNKIIRDTETNIYNVTKELSDLSGETERSLKRSRSYYQKQVAASDPKDLEKMQYNASMLNKIMEELERRKQNVEGFAAIFGNIREASDKALSSLRQRLQEVMGTTKEGTQEMARFSEQLRTVEMEQSRRVTKQAQTTLGQVQTGTFDGTIGQTKEAIKLLEQYKQQLKTSDTQGIKDVESAINMLNEKLKQTPSQVMSLDEALDKAKKVSDGTFDGTIQDLEKLKKALEEYRTQVNLIDEVTVKKKIKEIENQIAIKDTEELRIELEKYQNLLKKSDASVLNKINDALDAINKKQKQVAQSTVNVKDVIDRIRTAPLEELQRAAAQLQEELTNSVRGVDDYVEASENLRKVNTQIDKVKKSWQEHDSQIVATAKRLTSYVLVYAGFNEIVGRIKQMAQANFELSDSMADIQKTTGLTSEEIDNLTRNIDKIDTRTAQEQLYSLAASAGQAGLKSEQDVLGFVRAADQLTIALNELGNEGVNTLLKISNLTGEGQLLGTEKALLAIGSSINELSAASAATAGPITDIINRIGSVASVSKITMAEMAALGAVMDENAESAEVAGTALNSFISALQTNTRSIAMAVGADDKELDNMIRAGKTMDAMLVVLDKLKGMSQEDGLKAIAPLMKEFGSEGERMNRVITTLSQNTDVLRSRLELSRQAYAEATSVTNEANIKQESAIGIVNRLGNEIKETFVNSGAVEGLKSFLSVLLDFVQWIKSGTAGAEAFKTLIVSLTIAIGTYTTSVKLAAAAIFTANTYTTLWKEGFKALNSTMKKNVIGVVVAATLSLGYAIYDLMTQVSDVTKATGEYNKELERERLRVDSLFEGAKKENQEKGVRLKLINEINDRYGDYIGFILTERDSYEKLSAAQELVNAKIRERMALQLKEKLQERAAEKTAAGVSSALENIQSGFDTTEGISDARSSEALKIVQQIVNQNISKPIDEIVKQVYKSLNEKFSTKSNAYTYQDFFKVSDDIRDYITVLKQYEEEVSLATEEVQEKITSANKDVVKANYEVLNSITAEWNELQKVKTDTLNEKQLSDHNTQLKKVAGEYTKVAKQQLELLSGEEKQQLQSYVDYYEKAISEIEKTSKQKEPNIWGYGKTIEDASVDQLVAKYKQLFDERKTMREDADYTTAYAKEFNDRSEAMDWYLKKLKEIEAQLNKMGYNTSGNFLKSKSGTRGEQKEMNDQISAAMSALEAYFLRRQQAIRQAYLDEEITTEEMNRQIDATEEEHLLARVELRKKLLGEANTFNQELYGMEGKDLDATAALLKKMGEKETDGLRKNLEKDLLEVQNIAVRYRHEIEKELLKYNPFESLVNQFEESLDSLRLLNTDAEKEIRKGFGLSGTIDEDAVKDRMEALVSLAEDAYGINENQLRTYLSNIDAVWAESMSPEQMSLMLKKLRDFYQDSKAAAEKYAKDIKDMIDVQWETSGNEKMWEDADKQVSDRLELIKSAGSLGLASTQSSFLGTSDTDNAELEALRIKLEAAAQYYEQFESRKEELIQQAIASGATKKQAEESYLMAQKEAYDNYLAAREEQSSKELEITESKLGTLKDYTDAIVDFSEQMGEAAFGEVEDRKQAAKQLIQTTMNLTKQLIMQKIQELLTKKALKNQEVAIEQSGNKSITQSAGSTIISGLTASEKGMSGKVQGAIAGGSAKIIEELGWWGIPLIAVITAALNGLMGLAMSAFSKSKSEVASVTGASSSSSRVATGMLTYAQGDYPVLGNDGQVYNARYQKELKTGVYGGGAHFGIFSEKKPEMIVDGDTTRKLILNYPHIYESILTIARHGQLKSAAMPTFASGNYPSMPAQVSQNGQQAAEAGMSNTQMAQTLNDVAAAVSALTERLNQPISATMDPYGSKGAVNQLNKASNFMKKRGLIK